MRRWIIAWGPAVLWCATIFSLSAIPGSAIPDVKIPEADKLVHAVVYGILGALTFRGARRARPNHPTGRVIVVAVLLAVLYGITDEFHQAFVPRRTPDWHDAAADMVGALIGALICAAFVARRARNADRFTAR